VLILEVIRRVKLIELFITYNVKTQLGDIFNKEVQNMYSHIFNDKKAIKGCINMICYFLKFELLKETISFVEDKNTLNYI
jgi:hypothetical protein